MKLDHCVIAVSDWERSNAFYSDVLGVEVIQRDECSASTSSMTGRYA